MNPDDLRVILLWEAGHDTKDIADTMGWQECDVYNVLPRLRHERRRQRDGARAPAVRG